MTTRLGGVSAGPYAALNLGEHVGDDAIHVSENRRRVRVELALPSEPHWLKQVHGADVLRLRPHLDPLPETEADAGFTARPDTVCAVMSADCLPVLFCDDAGSVVAAAHAGWRGLAGGVLEHTVRAMAVDPATVMAWMGAAIGPSAFEVGAEVHQAFVVQDPVAATAFRSKAHGKFTADLFALARLRLRTAGVQRVYGGGICTHSDAARFFSHRRDGVTGRMAALIWLAP